MDTIFTTLFILFFGAITIMIFIQTNVELWNEVGKDFWNDMKSNITDWFDNTKMSMWYKNKKNKVEILSDREYKNLMESGRIKNTIIVMQRINSQSHPSLLNIGINYKRIKILTLSRKNLTAIDVILKMQVEIKFSRQAFAEETFMLFSCCYVFFQGVRIL